VYDQRRCTVKCTYTKPIYTFTLLNQYNSVKCKVRRFSISSLTQDRIINLSRGGGVSFLLSANQCDLVFGLSMYKCSHVNQDN
jgi:hypothetical protein